MRIADIFQRKQAGEISTTKRPSSLRARFSRAPPTDATNDTPITTTGSLRKMPTRTPAPPTPLSFLVILPSPQAHSVVGGPTALVSKTKDLASSVIESSPNEPVDMALHSQRRLSLAPGIGAGLSMPGDDDQTPSKARTEESSDNSPRTRPPAFGSRPADSARRRPQSSNSTATGNAPRPFVGAGRGRWFPGAGRTGLLHGLKARAGWEGDEVVNVLRTSGLEGK